MDNLEEISERVQICADCPLSVGRTQAVPGEGPSDADIVFIGEGPGYHEDQQGRPFVGPAGKFLDELLTSAGLRREDVFITNMVKCRPPGNRDPLPAETAACSKYLNRQLELVKPKVVVTLGRFSLAKFFPNETISRVRGKPRKQESFTIFPMLHPAAALHRQEFRKVIEEDFKAIPAVLKETLASGEAYSPPPEQLSMF